MYYSQVIYVHFIYLFTSDIIPDTTVNRTKLLRQRPHGPYSVARNTVTPDLEDQQHLTWTGIKSVDTGLFSLSLQDLETGCLGRIGPPVVQGLPHSHSHLALRLCLYLDSTLGYPNGL